LCTWSIFGNLGGETETPATVPKGPPTLVDALLFTTEISGSVNPHVAFAPVGKEFGVTAANVDLAASRTDKHQVVVGLALAPAAQARLGMIREAYFAPSFGAAAGAPLVAPLLTASPLTRSEAIAARPSISSSPSNCSRRQSIFLHERRGNDKQTQIDESSV
jgi:hypothetical protein